MRYILNRLALVAVAAFALSSCVQHEDVNDIVIGGGGTGYAHSATIMPSCRIENPNVSRAKELGFTVRSLIDQITTKQLDSNFLIINEDTDSDNKGKYTFTRGVENSPYITDWNKAKVLEATIISSPDNTEGVHYRSVSLAPEQQYSMVIQSKGDKADTLSFHHTRMVGWYPKNCMLPLDRDGNLIAPEFGTWEPFDAVRINDQVDIDDDGVAENIIGVHFKNFNGETDIMVSNVREAQAWHKYNASNPHQSDVHPTNGANIYREPFGHNITPPIYSNYFTYRHYRSAIRVTAFADQSSQSLSMWGEIQDVIIRNQATSCKIALPTELGEFGTVYEWGDRKNLPIVRTAMFGDDSNHPEYHEEAKYPISMEGSSLKNDIYLGYSLIEPYRDLELEIHTLSGVYTTIIEADHLHKNPDGTTQRIPLFEPGFIYHITLDFHTSGTISAILEKEGSERYYDLSLLHEYEVGAEENNVEVFKIANCYVIDPTLMKVKDENGNPIKDGNGNTVPWDGYCFLASVVGNGKAGIISQGAQTLYPESETISPVSAHLLWESELGLVTNVELKYGYVRFKVPKGESARGNAVIAVYDEDEKILWSWHIWITDSLAPVDIQLGNGEHHTITMLNRNIGATKSTCSNGAEALETYGLYYQWGRKDPSMGPRSYDYDNLNLITAPYYDYTSDKKTAAEVAQFPKPTLKDAIENPMYLILPTAQTDNYSFNWLNERYDFLWGYNIETGMTSKTIYDPCPYGYRVPSSELNHIFTNASKSEPGTYGHTLTFDGGKTLFFPYAGYKGVDVGMTSVVLPWKYVGQKGDYQSSMYCVNTDDYIENISHFMHRERIYISKVQNWEELSVGSYNAYVTPCYANRRTAAPVRCVKDAQIGSITGSISVDAATLEPGKNVSVMFNAHSYGSAIEKVTILVEYRYTNDVDGSRTLRVEDYKDSGKYNIEGTVAFHIPTDNDIDDNGITFRLLVTNEHGLTYSDDVELMETNVSVRFLQWRDDNSGLNSSNINYAIVGQKIRYYVGVLSSSNIDQVSINGISATQVNDYTNDDVPDPVGDAAFKTVWYVDLSISSIGEITMSAKVKVNGAEFSNDNVSVVKVAGISLGDSTTSPRTDGTLYVMQNTNYKSTYCTSANTNLSASSSLDYNSLFVLEKSGNNVKIKSVAKGAYCNGTGDRNNTNTSISFNANNGTAYTFSSGQIYSGGRYMRQSDNTTITIDNNSGNRTWQFFPVNTK
ncbi:MAG: hypothetical protein IKY57_08055 [Alistipes sp.]|nr:hypothetical protein [Alistipes sp.]